MSPTISKVPAMRPNSGSSGIGTTILIEGQIEGQVCSGTVAVIAEGPQVMTQAALVEYDQVIQTLPGEWYRSGVQYTPAAMANEARTAPA